ncbi:membrane-associated phospholipid phosphatase [Allocatelliglobosispora scoriae]|uniref:Membrane-associated phospholipid phosphatase n=1 Tax=Allocatelliglobosispora scoriae TaxID=643052 RepID=A0A841C1Y8_9ACTN|nr:vanadium-dependent haloperoxidase [Allocatelliglobosispora scoriae]MBB5873768.1 membrane-associated phospholipid phosphatase [Allocatelliglobosispora scoriae]
MSRLYRHALVGALTVVIGAVGAVVAPATQAQAAAPADHVLYWNDVLLRTYRQVGGAPTPLARAGAMMHGAIYDAANSATCRLGEAVFPVADTCIAKRYLIKAPGQNGDFNPVLGSAIDYAAVTVLRSVFPTVNFNADLATAQTGTTSSASQSEGVTMGKQAANAMIAARVNDGSTNTTAYTPGTVPGAWRETGSGSAATPNWGLVKPFGLTTGAQFRPQTPAGFTTYPTLLASSAYAAQVNEVKDLGSATSTTRTALQTQIAWFWANDLNGTYKPPGQLFAHTQIVAKAKGLNQRSNARLFALVGFAMADAAVAAWDARYQTSIDLWRPESAITLADTDGNAATVKDAAWQPLSADTAGVHFSPPFPAYVSGHATFGAAWAGAMKAYFGTDTYTWTATTEDPHAVGVTRTFTTFTAAATENARSRVYLGVHYQWDADYGMAAGSSVAAYQATKLLTPWSLYQHYADASSCQDEGGNLVLQGLYTEYKCEVFVNESADLYVR